MYYSTRLYEFVRFEKATAKNKKYKAILRNKRTNKNFIVNFGDVRYQHYRDSTGLKLYTHLDHLDKERKKNYVKRHAFYIKPGYYSPGQMAMDFLWS
jgi:hypothetical protein